MRRGRGFPTRQLQGNCFKGTYHFCLLQTIVMLFCDTSLKRVCNTQCKNQRALSFLDSTDVPRTSLLLLHLRYICPSIYSSIWSSLASSTLSEQGNSSLQAENLVTWLTKFSSWLSAPVQRFRTWVQMNLGLRSWHPTSGEMVYSKSF